METPICAIHKTPMKHVEAGVSRRTGKEYQAFWGCTVYECKETMPDAGRYQSEPEPSDQQKELEEFTKEVIEEEIDLVKDSPMTRLDWNIKEFIKGLGVFSAAGRAEGMDPKTAFESMHIWEWMDLAYGDMPGYESWKAKAKQRINQ